MWVANLQKWKIVSNTAGGKNVIKLCLQHNPTFKAYLLIYTLKK